MNTAGYFSASLAANDANPTISALQSISYIIPHLILAEPRILFTQVNVMLLEKSLFLRSILQTVLSYESANVLENISGIHLQINRSATRLQKSLQVQVALIFIKAFQDILAAFYALMKCKLSWSIAQYVLRGALATLELFFLIYPIEKVMEVVSLIKINYAMACAFVI